jgi:putative NADPH-quinone reductase
MTRTLILLAHPRYATSSANRALLDAAATVPGVEVADLYGLYPDGRIDTDAEVARLLAADRIVLQFPVQWYATPALLKEWQDAVLTRMFYIAPETEGAKLAGRPLLVAVTAGNVPEAYGPNGMNLFSMAELLAPLRAMANRCGLRWAEPFVAFQMQRPSDASLAAAAEAYRARLLSWAGQPAAAEAACAA